MIQEYVDSKPFSPQPAPVPTYFEDQLDRAFRGRLRIRWSLRDGQWHIEQKLGNIGDAYAGRGKRVDTWYDELVRQRDGYSLVMKVANCERIPCPRCRTTLNVEYGKTSMVVCTTCTAEGKDGRIASGYWPLGSRLIDHLCSIDPERASRNVKERGRDNDEENVAMKDAKIGAIVRDMKASLHDALLDQLPNSNRPR